MRSSTKILAILSTGIFAGLSSLNNPVKAQSISFECAEDNQNVPTTYAQTPDGVVEIFKWSNTFFSPPYTPKQRCEEVSQRLSQAQPDSLVAGQVNNYNVICFGTNCDPSGSNILLTLRPDQDPNQVLAEIDNTRNAAGGPSMQLGSGTSSSSGTSSNLSQNASGGMVLNLSSYIQSAPKIPRRLSGNSEPSVAPPNSLQLTPQPATTTTPTPSNSNSTRGTAW